MASCPWSFTGFTGVPWLFDAASGLIVDLIHNRHDTHDMADASKLHPMLQSGDVLAGDRGYLWLFAGLVVWPYVSFGLEQYMHHSVNRVLDGQPVGFPFSLAVDGKMTIHQVLTAIVWLKGTGGVLLIALGLLCLKARSGRS